MPKRVLIVDDDVHVRWAIRRLLEWRGYECEEAENGIDAIAKMEHIRFDLVITDHQMPVMSGVELVEWLTTAPAKTGVPVLLLSADLSEQERSRAMHAGVYAILAKPYDWEKLVSLVVRAVGPDSPP